MSPREIIVSEIMGKDDGKNQSGIGDLDLNRKKRHPKDITMKFAN